MPISPVTDIVMDVAQAADPTRLNTARQRLMAGTSPAFSHSSAGEFESENNVSPATIVAPGIQGRRVGVAATSVGRSGLTAPQRFEAEMLRTMIEAILPKEGGAEFGHGAGAGIWRSMLAEGLADQISKAGGIGLQRVIERQLSKSMGSNESNGKVPSSGYRAGNISAHVADRNS